MTETEKNEAVAKTEEPKKDAVDAAEAAPATNGAEEPPAKEMKAIVVQSFGGLGKSLKVLKKPEPSVAEGSVVIRVKACGLNFPDLMIRQGVIDSPPKTPFILGSECSGIVEAVGEGVDSLKVGDRVCALVDKAAWSELVASPAKFVYKIPDGMSFQDAAALTMNFVVAHCLLFDVGNLRSGQTALIHSLAGGVGQAIAQLCKLIPDVTLIGTTSKAKLELDNVKESAAHVLDRSADYVAEIKKISPDGVDLVLDCLCGDDANKGYNLLKPMGRYVLYGTSFMVSGETKSIFSAVKSWWQLDKINPLKLYHENKSLCGFNLRHLLYQQNAHDYVRGVVEKVYKLFSDGKIKPVIDSTWAFEDIPEAMQKMHDRKNIGKITLDPEMEPKPKPVEEENPKKRKGSSKEKGDEKKEEKKDAAETNGEKEEAKAEGN